MEKIFRVKGMSCSACASRVQRAASRVSGVNSASVNLVTGVLKLDCEGDIDSEIIKSVTAAGYEIEKSDRNDDGLSSDGTNSDPVSLKKRLAVSLVLTLIVMLLSFCHMLSFPMPSVLAITSVQALLSLLVIIMSGRFFASAYRALLHFSFNMDSLVSLGSLTAYLYSLYVFALAVSDKSIYQSDALLDVFFESSCGILTFVGLGKYLESRAVIKTSDVLNSLKKLSENMTALKVGDRIESVATKSVKVGDIAVYRQGQRISFDGVVVSGNSYLDESSITGEGRLVGVQEGSSVKSGSVLTDGYLEVRVESDSENSLLGRIIQSVQNASLHKTPISRIADTLASYFVPAVIILSLITFVYWYVIKDSSLSLAIEFAVCVLVVSCPCALGLATPVAIVAGSGLAASSGIIFKSPEAIELLGKSDVFVFDKTGTLTHGSMSMGRVVPNGSHISEDEILTVLCSLEKKSMHVIAQSVMKAYPDVSVKECENYSYLYGMGVTGLIDGLMCACGNSILVRKLAGNGQDSFLEAMDSQSMCIYVVKGSTLLGAVLFEDSIKDDASYVVQTLKGSGVLCVMLTGDTKANAEHVAENIGIDSFQSSSDPVMKSSYIEQLHKSGRKVTMVGDGINDAVALRTADVGIGLKGAADMAVKSCDVIVLSEKLKDVVRAYRISKKTIKIIYQDLFFALVYNVIAIPLAAGLYYSSLSLKLTPVICSILMGLSSLCVVGNALRLSFDKKLLKDDRTSVHEDVCYHLKIDGMHCTHCKASVEEALGRFSSDGKVLVSLEDKSACFKGASTPYKNIEKAVKMAGFELMEIRHDKS
ncbi:MAG: heavy metal translocating P-type ATPase [Succinivibrio sp.]